MPRNSGGRKSWGGSGGFKPGGSMYSNFKPIENVEANNLNVHKNAHVVGNVGAGSMSAADVTGTGTLKVPVVASLGDLPTNGGGAAGLLSVISVSAADKTTPGLYYSRLDNTAAAAVVTALATKNTKADEKTGADLANAAIAGITETNPVLTGAALDSAIDDAITNASAGGTGADQQAGSASVVTAAKAASPDTLAGAIAAAAQKATDYATALTTATNAHNTAVYNASNTFEWVAVN
tara:strand:- start:111 stop:821 length:711 start_codon:yes stop_codon:yes gene_type:complete